MRTVVRTPLLAAAVALLLGACSGGQNCTSIGCRSEFSADLTQLVPRLASGSATGEVTVTACVDGACESARLQRGEAGDAVFRSTSLMSGEALRTSPPLQVTVRVAQGDAVLLDAATTTTAVRYAANGEECGPICYFAGVRLDAGRLVTAG